MIKVKALSMPDRSGRKLAISLGITAFAMLVLLIAFGGQIMAMMAG